MHDNIGKGLRAQITESSGGIYRPITGHLTEQQLKDFVRSLENNRDQQQPMKEMISTVHGTDYCYSHSRLKFLTFPDLEEVDQETENKIIELINHQQ